MSRRNSPEQKRIRRLRRALQVSPDASMDLVQWLRDRGHADTVRKANALILNRQVRSESHPLGIARAYDAQLDREVEYVNPYVPASLRNTIQVIND